jgi:hypothetical protein
MERQSMMEAIVSVKKIVGEMDVLGDEVSAFLNKKTGEPVTPTNEEFQWRKMAMICTAELE